MSLRFIYGRAGSGKSRCCFQEIKSRIQDGCNKPLILLVPEDYSFQAEKDLLKVVGDRGLMQARVLSFKRMAYAVFGEAGGLARQHMNSAGRNMLIYRIMDELKGDFNIFTKAVKLPGFVNTISDMITEFKIYGVSPEQVGDAAGQVEDDYILKGKLEDIGLIYSKFEDALHRGYIDPEDDLDILSSKIDECSMFDGAEIWVDGFSVLTPQQYNVLGKLLKKAYRVSVTLTCDCPGSFNKDSGDLFKGTKSIEEKMLKIASDNNVSFEKQVELNGGVPYKFKDNPELAHIEENIYASPYNIYEDQTRYVSIFKAVNKYSEVENTAGDIVRLCRDEGYRFSDVAVVTGDVDGYQRLVGAIFSEYGIPYFIDKKRDIDGNPLVVMVLSAIEVLCRNWPYEAVFRYLKTGLAGIDREDVDMIENYVLSAGIKGRKWTDEKPWEYWPDYGYEGELPEDAKDRLEKINEIRNNIRSPLMKLYESVLEGKKAREVCGAIFGFLSSMDVPGRIESMVDEFREDGELDIASEYSKVWNIMIETLDQIVEVLGDEEVSLEQFARILSIGFGEYKIGLIPPSLDQVMFGSVESVKSHSVKALYIIGMNDGVFPSAADDEGILSDSDRELLKNVGLELGPGSREKVFDGQYLVYTTFTRTEKYLKVSFSIADHEGKSMRPSILITRLKKIFKNIREYSNITIENTDEYSLSLINGPVPAFNELVSVFRRGADGQEISPLWNDIYAWFMGRDEWRQKCEKALSGIKYSNMISPISPGKVKALYGRNLRFSISRLEKYAECPFSYFMQYGLNAKERKVYEFSPPDLGSFIHTVLDGFSKYLDENKISWREIEKDKCGEIVSSLVEKAVESMSGSILSSSARYRYLKERLKRIILRAVWLIALHIKRGGFEPSGHEVSFENGGKYPPISIELPSGEKLSLIGRIDRVDTMEDENSVYVRIVDYKSGNKSFNLSDIYNGLELQLLIYLDAILEYASKHSKKTVMPGGILYFRIDDPIVKAGGELTEEEVEKEIMKNLKMKGLLISDVKVVREMDRNMDGYSIIIPANLKMGSESFGPWSSVAGTEEFNALRKHVKEIIIKLCEDMLSGNISISPYKKKKETPCEFCSYKAVCRFDVTIKENGYRIISDKNKDEIWDVIKQTAVSKGDEA